MLDFVVVLATAALIVTCFAFCSGVVQYGDEITANTAYAKSKMEMVHMCAGRFDIPYLDNIPPMDEDGEYMISRHPAIELTSYVNGKLKVTDRIEKVCLQTVYYDECNLTIKLAL